MKDVLYLAWRYLAHHRIKTGILVASVTLIIYLPVGLRVLVSRSAASLTARAVATPLIIGARGSPLELVLNSLYFASDTPAPTRYAEVGRVIDSGLAEAIPLHTRFRAQTQPIVGTTLDYFAFRGLRLGAGRMMAMLGECVVGARAARALGVAVGDHVVSSPESVFDLAGVYPLRMRVVGVLARSDTPDDLAVFVDVRTTWVIEGLAHGHQDLTKPEATAGVLRREGNLVVANGSVMKYNEITADNVGTFHFHGDPATFPVTAVIALPRSEKASTLLRGRYLAEDERVQVVEPAAVMEKLLDTIFTVQRFVIAAVVIVSLSTFMTAALVFLLSLRLRRREIETLHKIGGARTAVFAVLASEIVGVLLAGVSIAAVLTLVTDRFGEAAVRAFLQ